MRRYYIECDIEGGAFQSERTFEVALSKKITYRGEDSGKLVGTAHVDYLRDSDKHLLEEGDPPFGEPRRGYVLCRAIRRLPDGWMLVEVPSADVIHVSEDSLVEAE
jgi:hypothetical protein